MRPLAPFGTKSAVTRQRVSRTGKKQIVSDALITSYFQELLGPRTYGSLLNIGAGTLSEEFDQAAMFAANEYHTFETPDCPTTATYLGTVNDMNAIPNDRYDWAISTAMLEHLPDPWGAAREMLRVVKPGGYLYVTVPFSQIVHYEPRYRDYWRFTPMGLGTLFAGTRVCEVECWGDNPARPNGFAVLLHRNEDNAVVPYDPVCSFWIDLPNEQVWQIYTDDAYTAFDWPIYRLSKEPMALAHQLHNIRNEYGLRANLPVLYDDVMRQYKHQYTTLIGTLGFRDGISYYHRTPG